MAAVFQNGCYAIRIIMIFDAKSHKLLDFINLINLYIKLYVFGNAKSDSDLKNRLDGPIFIYLHISAILKQIVSSVWLVKQFKILTVLNCNNK